MWLLIMKYYNVCFLKWKHTLYTSTERARKYMHSSLCSRFVYRNTAENGTDKSLALYGVSVQQCIHRRLGIQFFIVVFGVTTLYRLPEYRSRRLTRSVSDNLYGKTTSQPKKDDKNFHHLELLHQRLVLRPNCVTEKWASIKRGVNRKWHSHQK
jgi:hypothetical protein